MVKIHDEDAEIKPSGSDAKFASSASSVCAFCSEQVGKYSCPRCAQLYCSVACYKSKEHESCTEQFYKANVQEQIKANRVSEFEKDKLRDILGKYQEEDESGWKYVAPDNVDTAKKEDLDEDELKELEELVSEASPEQLLSLLSEEQKAQFEALYRSFS